MTQCSHDFTTHYHWEWFRRAQWQSSFRERKRHSSMGLVELMRDRGILDQPVLDCSCGLGLKTIVMREAGLAVTGSDVCAEAVRLARLLAVEEGHGDLPYLVSSWADLPKRTDMRYAAIFNDALSWVYSDEEMAASLKGLHDSLVPGGILTYMGALPGSTEDRKELLDQEWAKRTGKGQHWLGMSAEVDGIGVQEVVFVDRGIDFIDEHHLYVVSDGTGQRVENWCLRCPLKWGWTMILPFLKGAGFTSFDTKEFVAANGKPFTLVVATRD